MVRRPAWLAVMLAVAVTPQALDVVVVAGAVLERDPAGTAGVHRAVVEGGYPGAQIGTISNGALVLSGPAYEVGRGGAVTAHPIVHFAPPRELG